MAGSNTLLRHHPTYIYVRGARARCGARARETGVVGHLGLTPPHPAIAAELSIRRPSAVLDRRQATQSWTHCGSAKRLPLGGNGSASLAFAGISNDRLAAITNTPIIQPVHSGTIYFGSSGVGHPAQVSITCRILLGSTPPSRSGACSYPMRAVKLNVLNVAPLSSLCIQQWNARLAGCWITLVR